MSERTNFDDVTVQSHPVWTSGRIGQVSLAVIESALLVFLFLLPNIMDPIVNWINQGISSAGGRQRRETRDMLRHHASNLENSVFEAIAKYEDLNHAMSMINSKMFSS